MQKTLLAISPLIAIVVVGAISFMGLMKADQYLNLQATEVRNQAIDGCAQNSKYVHTETNGSTTDVFEEPNQGQFQKCLELKNIQ